MRTPDLLSSAAPSSPAHLLDEMSRLYFLSRAIHVVADLGVADHIGDEPVIAAQVATKTGTDARAQERLLRYLSA